MFKLEDGSFNDGFMCEDGVHLTNRGVNKLAKLLELRVINLLDLLYLLTYLI